MTLLVVGLALLGGGWLWLRHSSLAAVRHVSITGVSGPDAGRIRAALQAAARDMTTLDVAHGQFRTAVSPYPVVKKVRVSVRFPHGMTIRVLEQVAVATVLAAGQRIPVSADGTLLRDMTINGSLPVVPVSVDPGGTHVTGSIRAIVRMLAAAPAPLLTKVGRGSADADHGLVAQLREGPALYFGGADALAAKWRAVAAVLSDPASAGADYIDVSDPSRPAAGTGSDSGTSIPSVSTGTPSSTASPTAPNAQTTATTTNPGDG
ncbi:MAG: FtsQ-type POTRA domain-containing protein [Solirubrobacterales bacterium]|nr:FtsQ-type POTRA domain-containing protein [Solirubrobacterales bacterium]